MVGLSESVMNFDLARSVAVVSRSRDFQEMNKTELALKLVDTQNLTKLTLIYIYFKAVIGHTFTLLNCA